MIFRGRRRARTRLCLTLMWWFLLCLLAQAEPARDWQMFEPRTNTYACARDAGHTGRFCLTMRSTARATSNSYGLVVQDVWAEHYRGCRVRLSGYVRCQVESGWCGLWLRADGAHGRPLAFENMQKQPILGSTGWTRYQIELDVPAETESLHYGGLLNGRGQIWLDDFKLEKLGEAPAGLVELRKLRGLSEPSNLGFEQ